MTDLTKPTTTTFAKGMMNRLAETALPEGGAMDLANVYLDPDGTVQTRMGYAQIQAGNYHSLYSHTDVAFALVVKDSVLTRLDAALTETPITPVLGPVSYALLNGKVYWSDTNAVGIVTATGTEAWGLSVPGWPTATAQTTGGLDAGTYQLVLTYRSDSGVESGAAQARLVAVPEGGGILLTHLPTAGMARRVYLSGANGDVLHWHSDIPAAQTQWHIGRSPLGKMLDTQFCFAPPAASIVRTFQGRLLLAVGRSVYWTRALHPTLVRPQTSFVQFPDPVTAVVPISSSGVFISTATRTYFMAGANPYEWTQLIAVGAGIVAGTAIELLPELLSGDQPRVRVGWWSTDGVYRIGMPDGSVYDPTQSMFQADTYSSGQAAHIHTGLMNHVVTVALH